MSFADKAKNKLEQAAGKVKETLGEATGNTGLQADGRIRPGRRQPQTERRPHQRCRDQRQNAIKDKLNRQ